MSNPLIYVIWLLATGAAIGAYVYRRRRRSGPVQNDPSQNPDTAV